MKLSKLTEIIEFEGESCSSIGDDFYSIFKNKNQTLIVITDNQDNILYMSVINKQEKQTLIDFLK